MALQTAPVRIYLLLTSVVLMSICTMGMGQDLDSLMASQTWSSSKNSPTTFAGTRLGNGQSPEVGGQGELRMFIGHRFGKISNGFYEFFGLDQATMSLGFDYGFNPWFTAGFGRSTMEKTWDLYGKARILDQTERRMPLSLTVYASSSINTLRGVYPDANDRFSERMSYTLQALAARSFNRFSFLLAPVYLHTEFDPRSSKPEDHFSLGLGGSIELTRRLDITTEYYYGLSDHVFPVSNPLTIGLDIDTGGHLFQLILSNSTGMFEKALLTGTTGSWLDGDIYFGFNLVRTFHMY